MFCCSSSLLLLASSISLFTLTHLNLNLCSKNTLLFLSSLLKNPLNLRKFNLEFIFFSQILGFLFSSIFCAERFNLFASKPSLMAKTRPGKRDLDSYNIKGTNKVVHAGDCVLMRPSDVGNPPYVARVEKIEADNRSNVKVKVRWYYRPEESMGGRRPFHGAKELFLSDHYDMQSAHTIEGKCTVHSFKNYTKLENVGSDDYFCRFEYKAATGAFTPDRVAVYCKCEMPYNPDDLMVQCEGCKDWFHPSCMGMSIEEAKKLDHFLCSDCVAEIDPKRGTNSFSVSPMADGRTDNKRRKR